MIIALLLHSNVKIYIKYTDSLYAYIKVLGLFRIRLYPGKEPKKSLSAKELRRMHGKVHKKEKKKKEKKKTQKAETGKAFDDVKDMVKNLYDLIMSILKRLENRVKVRIRNLDITVAAKDAAATALAYSVVCNTLNLLIELLCGSDKIKFRIDNADCRCDYLAERFSASVDIVIKIKVVHTFSLLIGTLMNEFSKLNKSEE